MVYASIQMIRPSLTVYYTDTIVNPSVPNAITYVDKKYSGIGIQFSRYW